MALSKTIKNFLRLGNRESKSKEQQAFEALCELVDSSVNRASGVFDPDWYERTYPDVVADGQSAIFHYLNHGHLELRDPGPNFDTRFYLATYSDVGTSGLNPLVHYVLHGCAEGRQTKWGLAFEGGRVVEPRHVIVKEFAFEQGGQAAVLVTHAPAGRLKPHILPYMNQLSRAGLKVLLVANVDRPLELVDQEVEAANGIIVRDNAGYDFGAWSDAFRIFPVLFGADLLIMTNDSVVATADEDVFRAMVRDVRESRADITALTASHEYGWHLQSYFMALKPRALGSWAFQLFIRDIRALDDKDEVIQTYEVPFASKMKAAGLTSQVLYAGSFSANPTFFSWRELIGQGFPFIKILMLRDKFAGSTDQHAMLQEVRDQWPSVLKAAGFDVDLVRAALRAAEISLVPLGASTDLLINIQNFDVITEDHPLRVAFFGPWNYENGLGSASREILNAIRQTGVRVNAYPVMKPFHIHRLICPAIEITDFSGRPDIAIIHLNPDAWNILTDEQRAIIESAKYRIGYWVWETDTLPENWQQDLHSVDRVWTPSTYCAQLFSEKVDVPVDIVPHPVRVPARIPTDRNANLLRFGIDQNKRMILYIFDGASYLVRKNPGGLIRAFALSRLEEQGWVLVLKTKHLRDNSEAGVALATLAAATPGVHILEGSLCSDDITRLMAAADIYASPHCSEGFGLTVAEAMALAKPVVATDFSGTRDFIDKACGYPVPGEKWTLDRDYGHYSAGHSWVKVDEHAFAAALVTAAKAVREEDFSVGNAAQNQIGRLLSHQVVAKAISASFSRAIGISQSVKGALRPQRKFVPPCVPPSIIPDFSSRMRFGDMRRSGAVVPISLENDLCWNGSEIPEGDPNDWLLFAPRNAFVSPNIDYSIVMAAASRPDVSVFYADDVAAAEDPLHRLNLKPDFNHTLFVAQDYIGAPVFVRRRMLTEVGGLNQACASAVLYDLILRVTEAGGVISRISEVLLGYQGKRPVATTDARRLALVGRPNFECINFDDGDAQGLLRQRRQFKNFGFPSISIIVPTQRTLRPGSTGTYIETLLVAIAQAEWPMDRITVLVGDDIEGKPSWAEQSWPFRLKRVETPRRHGERFNYASKMNLLWRAAEDEHIIFLNDDVMPLTSGWICALMSFSVDEHVGGVGARLHYSNGSIQHAGMFPAFRTVAHAWLGRSKETKTYNDWALAQREWSAVTGAVFATRQSILQQASGFDERFALEFNDVDLCLRIRNLGYRIVYNPEAVFNHDERASRGSASSSGEEVALFLARWGRWLDNDPASHPRYGINSFDIVAEPSGSDWYLG